MTDLCPQTAHLLASAALQMHLDVFSEVSSRNTRGSRRDVPVRASITFPVQSEPAPFHCLIPQLPVLTKKSGLRRLNEMS